MKNLKNKNIICIVAIILVVLIILLLVINPFKKKVTVNSMSDDIKKYGVDYYTTFYYPAIEDPKDFLANFTDTGLTISLNSLQVTNKFDDKLVDSLKKKNCDLDASKVIITPKAPFGKTDYSVTVELSCK